MPNSCPSLNALARYLSGKTADNQTESIENHLVNCLQCQEQLESLSEEPDSIMRMIVDGVVPQLVASGIPDSAQSSASIPYPAAQHATSNAINSDYRSPSQGSSVEAESVTMIRDYRLMECIGQGGMGSVYRALHVGMNRQVALKILKSERMASAEAVSRFNREIELLAKLDNPHIVRALDAGEHDGLPYFVMEFVSGIDLSQLVRRVGPLPAQEACQIVRLAATALQYAHEQKVIHRDVKPSNLMITAESNIKLLDLGLAQILDLTVQESLTQANQALGTLAYMAPEQLSGRLPITQQSDIFSLGVTLHELLTGQRPFERSGLPPLVSDLKSIRPDIDAELNALVGSMLALSPAERPASMSEVVARLSTFAASAELPALLAEYYRWNHRRFSPPMSAFAQAETEPSQAASTDSQSVPPQPIRNEMLVVAPVNGQRNNRNLYRWLTGSACIGCIAAIYGITSWRDAPPVISAPSKGSIEIIAEGDLPLQIVEEAFIQVENIDTGKKQQVNLGTNELPPGTYRLNYDRAPEAFRDGGNATFEIFADSPSKLLIQPILAHRFQFPVIPTQAGAFASYRGTFWRAPWAETETVPYELNLEVLSVSEEPDQPIRLWLMIEVWHQDCGYTETAYLQISANRWEAYQEFEVAEGWLEAASPSIATYKLLCGRAGTKDSVVVPFDLQRDTLGDIALLPLPEQRLSVHDVVALFFGEKSLAAAACITRLRADLSQSKGRNEWLENGSFGACYVASSRQREAATTEPGYSVHRRESDEYNPYGFVALEVKMPGTLTAECILVKGSAAPSPAGAVKNLLETLRDSEFHLGDAIAAAEDGASSPPMPPATAPSSPENGSHNKTLNQGSPGSLPLIYGFTSLGNQLYFWKAVWRGLSLAASGPPSEQPQPAPGQLPAVENDGKPFDLASMPENPSIMTWSGIVVLDSQRPEEIAVTARMLHSIRLQDGGRECKWIEVEVTSRTANARPYTEVARVLIDAEAYDKSNQFAIVQANGGLQGWIAYGSKDTVFPIPVDGDLESLVDLRLQFEPQPQFDRIGVSHVLSMLFGAALKPENEICELRRTMGRIMAGRQRNQTQKMYPRKTGADLPSLCWESPMATRLLGSYKIYRSPEVPFGFVDIELTASGINIDLNMGDRYGPLPDDYRLSYFGTTDDFTELLHKQQDSRRPVPNWRVWTWRDDGRIYKAFAEFGGLIETARGSDVLLRDANNKQTRVPIKLLADVDRASLSAGRLWAKESFGDSKLSLWRVLAKDDNTDQLVLNVPSNSNMQVHVSWQHLAKDDQQWVTKLRTARKSSWDSSASQADWTAFAGYVGQ